LATHIRTAHPKESLALNISKFKCEYESCGQAFSFKHVLDRHVRNIHTNNKSGRKRRNDALEFDVIDALAGFDDEDAVAKMPFPCPFPDCNRRFTTEALLKRHLMSRVHNSNRKGDKEVTGQEVLRAMEQDENRTIQNMIALHLDTDGSSISVSSSTSSSTNISLNSYNDNYNNDKT